MRSRSTPDLLQTGSEQRIETFCPVSVRQPSIRGLCDGFLFQRSSIIFLGIPRTKLPTLSGRVPPRPEISIRRYTRSSLIGLRSIPPMPIAGYTGRHPGSRQTIKQHLTAIKMLFDYLVVSQVVPTNPTAPVKGPNARGQGRKNANLERGRC